MVSDHRAMRPSWQCASCGGPWPCHSAQLRLWAEFDGALVSLALYLTGTFVDACQDLRYESAGVLHHRFLGWIRSLKGE